MDFFREIAEVIFMFLKDLGYFGILFGLMVEVIPSEIVLAYGGYLISAGEITFGWALLYAVIGGTLAQLFLYWIGRYGGRPFLEKYGKYLLIKKNHLDIAERWFENYGTGIIFSARFVPIVRHAISIPAGVASMPLLRFTVLTAIAMVPWSIFFMYLGMKLGDNWQNFKSFAGDFVLTVSIIAGLSLIVYFFLIRKKEAYKVIPNTASLYRVTGFEISNSGSNIETSKDQYDEESGLRWFFANKPLELQAGSVLFSATRGCIGRGGLLLLDQTGWKHAKDMRAYLHRAEKEWEDRLSKQGIPVRVTVLPVQTIDNYADQTVDQADDSAGTADNGEDALSIEQLRSIVPKNCHSEINPALTKLHAARSKRSALTKLEQEQILDDLLK